MNFDLEWAKLLLPPFLYVAAAFLVLVLVWFCRKWLRELFTFLGVKSFSVAGVEVSLSTAEVESAQEQRGLEAEPCELDRLAARAVPYVMGRRILWVDDSPRGNDTERRAFRLLGITVHNRLSTREALEALCRDDYDLIITDYSRDTPGGHPHPCRAILGQSADAKAGPKAEAEAAAGVPDGGMETLRSVREVWRDIPVIFYHGNSKEQSARDSQVKEKGAYGATYSPATLYRWVLLILMHLAFTRGGGRLPLTPPEPRAKQTG